ncbi:matrixin family metalloprotease [Desertifilum sp. FACHB-1129]|uniref:Peptidase metallopeptidase domain-containing protein n=2 Tax=Desertifilum tharense IPPAS B-1220 TaxID=1781255 RepID=A0A1E5QLJ4_9CYAN|nr:matrixin family metalloprotease [Desertifilum tharense]MBD2310974.1 matrixin family metalloprotease [Desertifilum sp. FACHB-1129]MBD2321379.1 matrixin family metalloprotease [Desertifilum sp. FACHB-866]MBD2331314.1 matrixin family metalloprotease [Desertifilum sp. FACHB-868]MDA0208772.1 matrixin family metalloprotease [Cyanobacteria bacterium FC1]OEJ75549.1 hypothetical protein BH720_09210 [Desertifilum tharense IPPAS B-1220]
MRVGWRVKPWRRWAIASILLLFLGSVLAIATPALPPPQAHPLPPTLAQWGDRSGDYFEEIESTPLGYLVWSSLPISVYIEVPKDPSDRVQTWQKAVERAVMDWNPYLPLNPVDSPENADIRIWYRRPPLRLSSTGEILRARTAETRYEFYKRSPATPMHRCDIYLSPHQSAIYTLATARHELGHALGIWGHSPSPEDVMYFSQVQDPVEISPRDINTLKRIYEQPTRLGWEQR